ncbi:MAG: NUDIX hydrolase [Anaerolineae bacterium]
MNPKWLDWARELQAIAQNGLTYNQDRDAYDTLRFQDVQRVAAEIVAAHSNGDVAHFRAVFAAEEGHITPKVDVRGVVFRDDRILLVRERSDGLWTLPGGWADPRESPSEATVREVYEESGYRTRAVKLLALYDRDKHGHPPHLFHIYKVYFLCALVGGAPATSVETDGVDFFAEDDIPPLSLGRVTPALIARCFEHHRHPEWPTDFD